jgi:hypothetical protein
VQTLGNAGYDIVGTSGNDQTGLDFANFELFDISGFKWDDTDGDGVWDEGELGLEGWTINLDIGNDGSIEQTTTTDSTGFYEFTNLGPGTYAISEVQQTDWVNSFDGSTVITGVSGVDHSGTEGVAEALNFGNFLPNPTGQSPGFWKNHIDIYDQELGASLSSVNHDSLFEDVFGVDLDDSGTVNGPTLEEALNTGGGGVNALIRHAAGALGNAASDDLNFSFAGLVADQSVLDTLDLIDVDDNSILEADEVINAVQDLFTDGATAELGTDFFEFTDLGDVVSAFGEMANLPHLLPDEFS